MGHEERREVVEMGRGQSGHMRGIDAMGVDEIERKGGRGGACRGHLRPQISHQDRWLC